MTVPQTSMVAPAAAKTGLVGADAVAAIKDAARVHYGQPGFSIADRISKALPPPIMAKDIPLSGIVDPEHER